MSDKNVYNANPLDALITALELSQGIKLQREYLTTKLLVLNGATTVLTLEPKFVNGYCPYVDPVTLSLNKLDLTSQIPLDMCYSGQYPATYEVFANFMLSSYGVLIRPGEWTVQASGKHYRLEPGAVISADLTQDRRLWLSPTAEHPIFSTQMAMPLFVTDPHASTPALSLSLVGPTSASVGDNVVIAFRAKGGLEPYTFAVTGTPPVPNYGTYLSGELQTSGPHPFTVTVSDALGQSVSVSADLVGSVVDPVVASAAPDSTVGQPYEHIYRPTGGVGPYSVFSVTGLPLGLDLTNNCRLVGMPDEGTHTLNIVFQDSLGARFNHTDTFTVYPRPPTQVRELTVQTLTDWLELAAGYRTQDALQSHPTGTHWQAVELSHQNVLGSQAAALKLTRGYLVKTSVQQSEAHLAVAFWGMKGQSTMGGCIFSTRDGDSGFEISVSDSSDERLRLYLDIDGEVYGLETPVDQPVLTTTPALIVVQAANGWLSVHRNTVLVATLRIPDAPRAVTADEPFTIGRRASFPKGYQWNGALERVMVFNRRLWRDQQSFLYNNGQGLQYRDLLDGTPQALPEITHNASPTSTLVGVAYDQEIVFQGPAPLRQPTHIQGQLPPGLTLDTSDLSRWVVSGTPTTPGNYVAYYAVPGEQEVVSVEISISVT